mgnify:CR=1 FL=1
MGRESSPLESRGRDNLRCFWLSDTSVSFGGCDDPPSPISYHVIQPAGISFEVETRTRQIKVMGFDKEVVGQTAADIRKVRPPEPYQGKGIKYLSEKIRRKAGKSGKG